MCFDNILKWKQAWYLFNDGSGGPANNVIWIKALSQVEQVRRADGFPCLEASHYLTVATLVQR